MPSTLAQQDVTHFRGLFLRAGSPWLTHPIWMIAEESGCKNNETTVPLHIEDDELK